MKTYHYDYLPYGKTADAKGKAEGNPLGKFQVQASSTKDAIAQIARTHNPGDSRPVRGESTLRVGEVVSLRVGAVVMLREWYTVAGGDEYRYGVVKEMLGNTVAVELFQQTNGDGSYLGLDGRPNAVDFRASEVVGVPSLKGR